MSALVKFFLPTAVSIAADFASRSAFPSLFHSSFINGVPRAYAAVVLTNFIASGFVLIYLGMKVGKARAVFKERAKKEGDVEFESRYSYPKMYAEGFSETAKQFNNIQRGHQQALETYPQFLILSAVAGLSAPIATALGGLLWCVARLQWASGYSVGASARYSGIATSGIWSSLILFTVASIWTGFRLLAQ